MGGPCDCDCLMECGRGSSTHKLVGVAEPRSQKSISETECSSNQTDDFMTERQLHTKSDAYYCNKDLFLHCKNIEILLCGCFYFSSVGSSEAKQLLKHCAVGTYIVRNSSDPRYLYTISVKTKRGPTSIRVCYEYGHFSLDADERSKNQMPKFETLLHLIDFYVRRSEKKADQCRFLDKNGKKDLPIVLIEPRRHSAPSLKHLTRTLINRSLPSTKSADLPGMVEKLPLPKPLKNFVNDYPFLH